MSLINTLTSPAGLRLVLWADALSGSATAVLHLALAASLSALLGLPTGLLSASGILLLLYVALAGSLALQSMPSSALLGVLVIGNFAWVAACLVLLFGGVVSPTPLGQAYLVVQGVAVLVLAELQWMALRRRRSAAVA
ncbi:hypothetical protein [Hydrogenophaga sp.]|uniref:hypothetical protein n=1 Tax=Hydrogenophaga sp. TaxID=1904254 RepID=UPI002715CD75|nr:hypothetical protein [Hydrogenophaga sp.]MDO9437366.1 hypothetical protein [Hydrogenophaga sp.]